MIRCQRVNWDAEMPLGTAKDEKAREARGGGTRFMQDIEQHGTEHRETFMNGNPDPPFGPTAPRRPPATPAATGTRRTLPGLLVQILQDVAGMPPPVSLSGPGLAVNGSWSGFITVILRERAVKEKRGFAAAFDNDSSGAGIRRPRTSRGRQNLPDREWPTRTKPGGPDSRLPS